MSSDLSQEVIELTQRWRADPMKYMDECLGIEKIWKLQQELINVLNRAIKENKPIFIASGHALGKDYICGAIANWFLDCFIPSKVVLTAPSDRQVKRIMWAETLGHFNHKKVKLWGSASATPYIEIRKEDWFLIGFATKETGAAKESGGGKFQGLRGAMNMCIIVTEAQAIEDNINDQIDAVATAENCLRIFLGNPTRAKGFFAKGLRDTVNNIVFHFSCLENPNYIHREVLVPGLATYKWVEDKRIKWGEEDPRWVGRVLGQIPKRSINNVFSQENIDDGLKRGNIALPVRKAGVSIDVAGEGDDENVIYGGVNGMIEKDIIKTSQAPSTNAINSQKICSDLGGTFIIVDCDGMGIKEWQELNKIEGLNEKINLIKFHGCSKLKEGSEEDLQFENLRALAYFKALERVKDGEASIPNDETLIEELLEVKWFENSRGRIQLEEKSDIKERLGRSPGRADAFVMLQYGFYLDLPPLKPEPILSAEDKQGLGEKVSLDHDEVEEYSGYG